MLLQHGANGSLATISGKTPLFYAIIADDTNAVVLLLQHGADPTHKDEAGKTLLEYAKDSTNEAIVRIMSEAISKATNK
jgi:uncharacterized protein